MEPYDDVSSNMELSRQIFDVRTMRSINKYLREKTYEEVLDQLFGNTISKANTIDWISRHPEAIFRVRIDATRAYRNHYYNDIWLDIVSTDTPNEYMEFRTEGDSFLEKTMVSRHIDRDVITRALSDGIKGNITDDVRKLLNAEAYEDVEVSSIHVSLGYIDAYEYMREVLAYLEGDKRYLFGPALEDYIMFFLLEKDMRIMGKFVLCYWLDLNLASMEDGDFSFVDEYKYADDKTWDDKEVDRDQLAELRGYVPIALSEYIQNNP